MMASNDFVQPTEADLKQLAQRQEVILSQLEQLSTRVDKIAKKFGTNVYRRQQSNEEISVITSLKSDSRSQIAQSGTLARPNINEKSRMNLKEAETLNKQQNLLFSKLLNIASGVQNVAKSKNIQLPDQNIVDKSFGPILEDIERRQEYAISKLQFLISMAKQSTGEDELDRPSLENRRSGTPSLHSKRRLSSAGLEPMQILPIHDEPKETESEEYIRRINELSYSVSHLKEMLNDFDINNNGLIEHKDLYNVLSNMNLGMDLQHIMHSRHIAIIVKLMTNSENNDFVNYNNMCQLILDVSKTDRSDNKHEWNHLRRNLIGMERKEGCLRIHYRFDGWPLPLTIRLFHSLDTRYNIVYSTDIARMIKNATQENVKFEQIRYAQKSKHEIGKIKWEKIEKTDPVPLHVSRDGWLEVDVWLRTKEFLDRKPGKPFPKYA